MPQNFNVDPYYDDFDSAKNFHRILFKPGYAVQARELTQSQTILQDQVTKFADNIFKQNSPVTGGQVTTNFNCFYIKLQETYNNTAVDVTQFQGKIITNETGNIRAKVISAVPGTGTNGIGDPPTLIVTYLSGIQFTDNDVVYDSTSNLRIQALPSSSTGSSSVVSIAQGVFYVNGIFVQVNETTIVLDKYSKTPSKRIGLNIIETIQDYIGDSSLLDPAIGASNYQAPGADRYQVSLSLETRPLAYGDDDAFIELVRVTDGSVTKMVDGSVYNVIDDYFAKRDYETNGDYIVNDFKLTPKVNDADSETYTMSVGKGIAYVHGYRVESQSPTDIITNRARTFETQNNNPVFMDFGSYFYVDTVQGANGSFFDTTTYQTIDLHCVDSANINTISTSAYSSTLVSSGYIRSLVYDHNISDTNANTFVYKTYVSDLQNSSKSANAVSATTSTIQFPTYFSKANGAYTGVNISITTGKDAGDSRTITAYNGVTHTATVNQNWTTTPDTTSIFSLNFDIKDIESIVNADKTSYPATINAHSNINAEGKTNGLSTGDTVLENPNVPELLFNIGDQYVKSSVNASFTTQQVFREILFSAADGGGVSARLDYSGEYTNIIRHFGTPNSTLSSDLVKQNYTIVVTAKGTNTAFNVGDIVPWTAIQRTITLDNSSSIATLTATDLSPFTATIVAKVFVSTADNPGHIHRAKNLITANTTIAYTTGTETATYTHVDNRDLTSTGQVYIQNAGLVAPGTAQSLYLSDVKNIVKILDTGDAGVTPTTANLASYSDITNNYIFDNGQRDNYYDHATITLRPGALQPIGNILVFVNYYQHVGGDGHFDVLSYTSSSIPELYQQIPQYTSKHGMTYSLRDCLDFRPSRVNASNVFQFRYANSSDTKHGVYLPVDLTIFQSDYSYYLGRQDKLILTKDKSFQIIEGTPSLNPVLPSQPEGSLVIAELTHKPYTGYIPTEAPNGYVSDLSVEKVKHKRYTMQDIAGLETRINNVEYYTSLSQLEQNAQSLQISDAYGLNRFKNGIMVDDFSSYATADTFNNDYSATINRRTKQMTATQNVKNFPLKSLALAYNLGLPSSATSDALGYAINSNDHVNYFSLPYTTANVASQKFASRTVNVNPFSTSTQEGVLNLSPNVDNWVDTNYSPALLITDPNLQVFRANSAALNVLSAGDWQTISGTSSVISQYSRVNHGAFNGPFGTNVGFTATVSQSITNQQQTNIVGQYDQIGNTYALNNGYVTDVSVLPYIRPQQVLVKARALLFNSPLNSYFDNISVNQYIRKANVIELTNVSGTFNEGDVVGYYNSPTFTPTGMIVGVYNHPNTTNVRLYVVSDGFSSAYYVSGTFQNAQFDGSGNYQSTTAHGTLASTDHFGGRLINANTDTKICLSKLASRSDGYYTGNTIYFCSGSAEGQSATISHYYGANQVAILSSSVTAAVGDIYSLGSFESDENGSFNGVFNIPENTFHTGQRVLRIDNSTGGNQTSATTFAESTYYAEGLQTTQQQVDFGASPAGAKNTFTQVNQQTLRQTKVSYSPYDPVAQTFIIDGTNYPNGIFLKSIKLFFRTKPNDNSPITLSIVGTLNGYPNGQTLDHSIVTMTPNKIKAGTSYTENPQFLDSNTYTNFEFGAPVYIQPNTLYAFIVKTNSSEYTLWTAANGDTAVKSSVKNLPTDDTPSIVTKIGSAPYVGALFMSQNSQTWTADQNQSLMFVADRCVFDTQATPTIEFVVPKKLPQRTLVDQSINYFLNANNVLGNTDAISNTSILVDSFNITTTDFVPTTTNINYSYNSTLQSGLAAGQKIVTPGKYGTSSSENIYLNDGKGERVLDANSQTSFSLYTQLSSNDPAVSPIISDAGLTTYAITWNINNAELSNNLITVVNGGSNYSFGPTVTISAPTGKNGSQAYASANVSGGAIQSIYITNAGSGYIETPTITITDGTGSSAVAIVTGETSATGGPAIAKYLSKKVVLAAGNDSGDLNVYLTAYRPVNTDINVYYKILNRSDTQSFDSGNWQLMTKTNSSDTLFSKTRTETYEYSFAPGTGNVDQGFVSYTSSNGQVYSTFSQFAIKVVLTTTDKTSVPYLTDIRALALPSNVNTTV
jgi:hypothetical protein